MDNAGGGRRGLRAAPSPDLFERVREAYGIAADESAIDLGGSANLNLLIGGRWVVRVYRPYVTPARLDAINIARSALALGGVPTSEALPGLDGRPWTTLAGRLIEVEPYICSDGIMNSWERLEAGLPLLGRAHTVLVRVKVGPAGRRPEFANHVEPGEALGWAMRASKRIAGWEPTAEESELALTSVELARRLVEAERGLIPELPRQLVHGDFWDNNVLFRDDRVVLVTDLDFMGERARIDDLALTLYFAATGENFRLADDPARLARLVDAYDSGLEPKLTESERLALPLAVARQPLWAAGKWLASLDAEETARRLAAEVASDVAWALRIVQALPQWQAAFGGH
jgi:homoserine kinase type II